MTDMGFSLEDRVLCSDGACIGLIGPDGTCNVCSKPYQGSDPLPKDIPHDDLQSGSTEVLGDDEEEIPAGKEDLETREEGDPNERVCCPDDTCIGIIGEDNKCGTCGKMI
ncbi:MAG: hypothetical protein QNJ97_20265 [Myxococcota bacterium]|nr:hypothetical protein [Myxococcota bacterium]